MWRLWIHLVCALAAASAVVVRLKEARGSPESSLKFAESQTSPLNVECHVGSVCTIHNAGLAKLDKSLIPSWIVRKVGSNDTFHGVPTDMDAGTHIVPELGLVVQVTYSLRGLAASCLLHRTSPTVAVVSLDTDLGRLPGDSRIDLFLRLAKLLHSTDGDKALASVFYLSRARNQPENLKNLFLLATGPGNTNTMRTNGSLLAWRVGCGSVAPTQLSSLQRLEKTAVTGELSKRLGFPVRQWFVADDRRLLVEARRLRRHRNRRSPTVNQWGPGGVAGPDNYLSPEGSGSSYYDGDVGASGVGPIFEPPGQRQDLGPWPRPRPTNDRMPEARLPLPKYIAKVGEAHQIFTIEEGTFHDPEDGTNLRLELLFKNRNVNDLRGFWLEFLPSDRRIVVKDVSAVDKKNHSFTLCAYDRVDNQICQKLTIQVGSNLLATITINIFAGEYFERPLQLREWKAIEHNVDDDKRMLIFAVSEINRKGEIMNNTNSWVGFDTGGYQFYCFPSLKLVDHTKEFRLFVRRRDGRRSGFFKVFFKIGIRRQDGLTHTIAMNISNPSYSASKFLNDPWLKVEFLKALASAFGAPRHLNFFLIQKFDSPFKKTVTPYLQLGYSRRQRRQTTYNDRKLVTVEWAHRQAFSRDGVTCDVTPLRIIMNRLFELQEGQVVWRKQIRQSLRPFVLHGFRVEARGVCENKADKFIPSPSSRWLNLSGDKTQKLPLPPEPTRKEPKVVKASRFRVHVGLMFKHSLRFENSQPMDLIQKTLSFSRGFKQPPWVEIEDDKLYGLPMLTDLGEKKFRLNVIKDREVVMYVDVIFEVVLDPDNQNLNHRVTMNILPIDGNFEISKSLRSRLQLVEKLETFLDPNCNMGYGKNCGQGIALLKISERKDVTLSNKDWARILEVDWAWRLLYNSAASGYHGPKKGVPQCPRKDIEENLIPRLYVDHGNKRTILLENALKEIGFKPEALSVGFSGPCVKQGPGKPNTEKTKSTMDDNHSMPVWKILLIAGMVIGVLLAALAATVFFCLKTQRGDKGGPEPEPVAKPPAAAAAPPARPAVAKPPAPMPEKQPLRQPQAAKPTFEEMEDAAAAPTKPLILPHEKPPVPPPDFGVIDLSARPAPAAPSRSQQPTLQRRPLNPYRNMPPNFTR